jgi:FAD:protein FMN transferase
MGTRVAVVATSGAADDAVDATREVFEWWEATFSRFRPGSELSAVNAAAGTWTEVTPFFLGVLATALVAASDTDGVFDPALGLQIAAIGYDKDFGALPVDGPPPVFRPGGGWRRVRLDARSSAVAVPPGAALDFGGIAKGLAVDAALARLARLGLAPALVEAGGDLGVTGVPQPGRAWPVALRECGDAVVHLTRGALATSATGRRRWRRGAAPLHHLIDPRSGRPATTGVRSATVAADACGQAEVAAKAALVLGPRRGARFLEERGLAGLLLLDDGRRVAVGDWPESAS